MNKLPIIVDNDGGPDDLAGLHILNKSDELAGIVATYGCAPQERVAKNVTDFFHLGGTPVKELLYQGANVPHQPIPGREDVPTFFGSNGMCDVTLPDSAISPHELRALHDLAQKISATGECEYIVTGPCTTLAQLIDEHPQLIRKNIKTIYFMGTAINSPGNEGPLDPVTGFFNAEYNVYLDPIAFERILTAAADNKIPVRVISWDQCKDITIPKSSFVNATPADDDRQGWKLREMILGFFDLYGSDKLTAEESAGLLEPVYTVCDAIVPMARTGKHGDFIPQEIMVGTCPDNYGVTRAAAMGGLPIEVFMPNDIDNLRGATLFEIGLRVRG